MYRRTVLNFEVDANIPCFLSYSIKIEGKKYDGSPWQGIMLNHTKTYKDPRKGTRLKYFKDRYFINTVSEHEWKIGYFISLLGGKPFKDFEGDDDVDTYIEGTLRVLEDLKGEDYFLKTRLVANKNKLFLSRGEYPYVSKEPDLKYLEGEEEYHKFIITKGI